MTAANAESQARFAPPPNRFEIRVQPGREAVRVRPIGDSTSPEAAG
jgi:hypothetical protein